MDCLPTKYNSKDKKHKDDYLIFVQATLDNIPYGITLNTENLKLGQLIHMDFYFVNETPSANSPQSS